MQDHAPVIYAYSDLNALITRKNNAFRMRRPMRGVVKKINCFHKDLVLANHTPLGLDNDQGCGMGGVVGDGEPLRNRDISVMEILKSYAE